MNQSEITVHQVQTVLQRQPSPAAAPETAARRALDNLVEQELAAQGARSQGLDKDPEVLQMLEAARREVLARAYQDRLAAAATGPASDDIDRFYDSHPGLFAQRRLYTLHDFIVDAAPDELARLRALAAQSRSAKELGDKLAVGGWKPRSRIYTQAAEDLPLGLLPQLLPLEAGQTLAVEQTGGMRLIHVLHAQAAPVDRRTAADAVAGYLRNERRRAEVQRGMQSLREAAKIAYQGSFATAAPAPAASRPVP